MTATLLTHPSLDIALRPMPGRAFIRIDAEAEKSPGGIFYPDTATPVASQGTIEAIGEGTQLDVGERVAIQPASGACLSVSQPRFQLPDTILEIDEGDVMARWDNPHAEDVWADLLPPDSIARRWSPIEGHVLLRPYSPLYARKSGLIAWKNDKWPKVWGHILAADWCLLAENMLDPGDMVVFSRYADELLGYDQRINGDRDLAVVLVPIEECKLAISPSPVTLEVN